MPPVEELPVLSVSELTVCLSAVVESHFPKVFVEGEISNLTRASSGHLYFTLKDNQAQLKAAMWRSAASRLKFVPQDGQHVIAIGPIEVFGPRGQYQLIVDRLSPQGAGAQELALRKLHEKLSAEGLFDPARKRPLPKFPRVVALVTSPTGAAVRDMLEVMGRRWPAQRVVVVPTAVQGEGAGLKIARALVQAGRLPEVDVILCGRGGGSSEDLWAFNDEVVARAIAASPVPVISAVGHEIDVTIADLVADRRALTPSEAAELAVPLRVDVLAQLAGASERMTAAARQRIARERAAVEAFAARRCFRRPLDRFRQTTERVDELSERMRRAVSRMLKSSREKLEGLAAQLDALSPLRVLDRGYTLTKLARTDRLVRSTLDVQPGDELSTLTNDGMILSTVARIDRDD